MTTDTDTFTPEEMEIANPYELFEQFVDEFNGEVEKIGLADAGSFDTSQLISIYAYLSNNFVQVKYPNGRPVVNLGVACPEYYEYLRETQKLLDAERTALINDTEAVRVASGLDDTTFLTHLKLMGELSAEDEEC